MSQQTKKNEDLCEMLRKSIEDAVYVMLDEKTDRPTDIKRHERNCWPEQTRENSSLQTSGPDIWSHHHPALAET